MVVVIFSWKSMTCSQSLENQIHQGFSHVGEHGVKRGSTLLGPRLQHHEHRRRHSEVTMNPCGMEIQVEDSI